MSKPKKLCAVCGEPSSSFQPLYPFPLLLKELGFKGMTWAHPACVKNEQAVRVAYRKKYGVDMAPGRRN